MESGIAIDLDSGGRSGQFMAMGNSETPSGNVQDSPGDGAASTKLSSDILAPNGLKPSEENEGRTARRKTAFALLLVAVVGLVFGLPSLSEPFGVDQGIYGYIAERILEGAVDHRDVFDHKPPGIHFAYAFAFAAFGHRMWSVWALDLLAVIATGWGLYVLGRGLGRARAGLLCGVFYVVYYEVFFNWLWRAQPETWLNLTFVWALALVVRSTGVFALLGSGALLAVGVWFKPTLVMLAPLWLVLLIARSLQDPAPGVGLVGRNLLAAAAGGFAASAVVLAYYVANGALQSLYEALIVFNVRYHTSHDLLQRPGQILKGFGFILEHLYPLTILLVGSVAAAWWGVRRWTILLGWVWLVLAYGTVFWQGSFARSHYVPVLAPLAFLAAIALDCAVEAAAEFGRRDNRSRQALLVAAVALIVCLVPLSIQRLWEERFAWFIALKSGRITRERYFSAFHFPGRPYHFEDLREMGAYIEANTSPDDPVLVWGFRPLIAWLADRRMPTRFCFRYPLTRANNPRWWNEFLSDLDRAPPVFFIVATEDPGLYHPTTSKVALERNEALSLFLRSRYQLDQAVPGFEIYRHRAREEIDR